MTWQSPFYNDPNFQMYSPYAKEMAAKYGVPQDLFLWQIGEESSWRPNVTGGAPNVTGTYPMGIAQFIPETAAWRNVDPWDPYSSLEGAASYMADLYKQKGSWLDALKSYGTTSGPEGWKKALEAQSILTSGGFAGGTYSHIGGYDPNSVAGAVGGAVAGSGYSNQAIIEAITGQLSSPITGTLNSIWDWISDKLQTGAIFIVGIIILAAAVFALMRKA